MVKWFIGLLYGSTPAEFESDFSLQESVNRLRAATKRTIFSAIFQQAAVGRVTAQQVSLHRVIPLWHNSFKPFFRGSFHQNGNRIVLSGRFTMRWFTKAFLTVWFGFCLFAVAGFFLQTYRAPAPDWREPLFGIGFFMAAALLVRLGQWCARSDAAWLSQVIRTALSQKQTVGNY